MKTTLTVTAVLLVISSVTISCKKKSCDVSYYEGCSLIDYACEPGEEVCGCDGVTYPCAIDAKCRGGITVYKKGPCKN